MRKDLELNYIKINRMRKGNEKNAIWLIQTEFV